LAAGDRWDIVFNFAEGLHGFGRESQIPCMLEGYSIPCTFSDSLVLSLALHKETAKRIVKTLGVPTPEFAVIHTPAEIDTVKLPFPLFAKPMAEGTSIGIDEQSVIRTASQLKAACCRLLEKYTQPVLVETFLSGREVTVGIVGTGASAQVVGALEIVPVKEAEKNVVYSYVNKEECEERIEYRLADDAQARQAAQRALAVWRGMGCRDAGRVDFRADDRGDMCFLELNPLAGLHPTHSDLPIAWCKAGRTYSELIKIIMDSAIKRIP
jgi:D-alanine-D-alanine ligase